MKEFKAIYYGEVLTDCEVARDGSVRNLRKNKELISSNNGAGYLTVPITMILSNKSKTMRMYVHRLVASSFIENPNNLPQVNHKDCNKSNNFVENLEWISRSNNILHSHKSGRMEKRYKIGKVIYLTVKEVIECYTRVKQGEGVNSVAVSMGRSRTTISSIINKRSRSSVTDAIDEELLERELKYATIINTDKKGTA